MVSCLWGTLQIIVHLWVVVIYVCCTLVVRLLYAWCATVVLCCTVAVGLLHARKISFKFFFQT